jgi:uncharacterized protein (DUF58 family)
LKSAERVYIVPTRYGFLYAFVVIFLLALSTFFNNTDCLIATAVLVTFGVVCMHQTNSNVGALSIKEVDSQSGFANEAIPWRFKILNQGTADSFSINIFDDVIDLHGKETSTENIFLHPKKRGRFHLDEVKISSTYPLGLFYSWKWSDVNLNYYVYPALGPAEIVLANFTDRKSELESRDDFIGHRNYIDGDSAHHIDWKAQARRQKLLVKLFESTNTNASVLDWERVPGKDIEEKLSVLTRAVHECHQTQTPFGLIMPSLSIPVGVGTAHYEHCLKYLATFGVTDEVA